MKIVSNAFDPMSRQRTLELQLFPDHKEGEPTVAPEETLDQIGSQLEAWLMAPTAPAKQVSVRLLRPSFEKNESADQLFYLAQRSVGICFENWLEQIEAVAGCTIDLISDPYAGAVIALKPGFDKALYAEGVAFKYCVVDPKETVVVRNEADIADMFNRAIMDLNQPISVLYRSGVYKTMDRVAALIPFFEFDVDAHRGDQRSWRWARFQLVEGNAELVAGLAPQAPVQDLYGRLQARNIGKAIEEHERVVRVMKMQLEVLNESLEALHKVKS